MRFEEARWRVVVADDKPYVNHVRPHCGAPVNTLMTFGRISAGSNAEVATCRREDGMLDVGGDREIFQAAQLPGVG